MKTTGYAGIAAALLFVAACDDGGTSGDGGDAAVGGDAATTPDGATPDGGVGTDGGAPPTPTPTVVALSPAGSDTFYAAAFDAAGNLYAAGFTAGGFDGASDRSMVVAKFLPSGAPDTTFGANGVATKNVAVGGGNGEFARGIVVQSTGRVVVAGSIEHDVAATGTAASDRDIALVGFEADGTIDDTFGDDGVVVLDLNTGVETMGNDGMPTLSGADVAWGLTLAANDALVVHGAQRAEGLQDDGVTPRADTDFALVRLTADGALDASFGDAGRFTLDIEGANATPKEAIVLGDGSIVAGGYANTPSFGTVQPVVYKVTPAGELDASFATGGLFHREILAAVAEVYSLAVQGDKIVTAGYGRNTESESIDWLSLRMDGNGQLDPSWGDRGAVRLDRAGFNDNARDIAVLSDGRVVIVGGGRADTEQNDAMVGLLTAGGEPDTNFAPDGLRAFDLGGASDMFWSVAVSPAGDRVAVVGAKTVPGDAASAADNDDAALLILPLE